MFVPRNRIRQLATRVLFAWLLALATGIVNACVVGPGAPHAVGPAQHHEARATASAHEHCGDIAGADHARRSACAKFCDDPSTGIQNLKQPTDPSGMAWLAMPPVAVATTSWHLASREPAPDPERWRPLAPIPIAFLRLTL